MADGRPSIMELPLPASQRRLWPVAVPDLVRLGRDHDGGYVVPRSVIAGADGILALGLYDDWSFEAAAQKLNPALRIDGYDHSIGRSRFAIDLTVDALRLLKGRTSIGEVRRRFHTLRAYKRFFAGRNRHFAQMVTGRPTGAGAIDFTSAIDRLGCGRVFVKMDIEGAEYRVIGQVVERADAIVGACIEFHDADALRPVFDRAVDALLTRFAIVHVHANNYGHVADDGLPDGLEITFVNRSVTGDAPPRKELYLPDLDQPNDPARPELALVARKIEKRRLRTT